MGKMKNLHIDMLNEELHSSSTNKDNDCHLPLWVREMYSNEEVERYRFDEEHRTNEEHRANVEIPFDDLTDEDRDKVWNMQDPDPEWLNDIRTGR